MKRPWYSLLLRYILLPFIVILVAVSCLAEYAVHVFMWISDAAYSSVEYVHENLP
jgi:hypothetical protein